MKCRKIGSTLVSSTIHYIDGYDLKVVVAQSAESKEKRPQFLRSVSSVSSGDGENIEEFEAQKMAAEERQSGNLKWEVVSSYFTAGGNWCFIMFALFMIFLTAAAAASVDYWISFW